MTAQADGGRRASKPTADSARPEGEVLEIDWGADLDEPLPVAASDDDDTDQADDARAAPADASNEADGADEAEGPAPAVRPVPGDSPRPSSPPTGQPPAEPSAPAEPRWSTRDRTRERELLALVAELPEDDPRRQAARDEIVTMHMPLAAFLARRFRDRGESLDDLTQVASIGLIKAVDRFEPERGVEFSTFATPTMVGEIKRHFRDKGWAIRVPRRLQELRISITRATAELSQSTGRSPTVAELAKHLDVTEEDILEGMESAQAYATLSLDATTTDDSDSGASLVDTLGQEDPSLVEVETRETLNPLLAGLAPRERRIIHMRFFENMTQAQIAEQIGVSQMHVSRLLAKSLAQMRTSLDEPGP